MGTPLTVFNPLIDTAEIMAELRQEVACSRLPNVSLTRWSELYVGDQHEEQPLQLELGSERTGHQDPSDPAQASSSDSTEDDIHSDVEPEIFFVTPWYGEFAGGAEAAVRSFAEQLVRRGWNVEVLTTCCRDPYASWWQDAVSPGVEQLNGVTVRRFPVNPEGENPFHELSVKNNSLGLSDAAEQNSFVVNSINSRALIEYAYKHTAGKVVIALPYNQGLVHSLVTELEGRVCVMSCLHDEPQFYWSTTGKMLAASRRLLYLTEEEKSLAIRHYGSTTGRPLVESPVIGVGTELPDGIEELLSHDSQVDAQVEHLSLPPNYFVYLGRKDVGKNVPLLVQNFKAYRAQGGQAHLLFLGGGVGELVPSEIGIRDLGYLSEKQKFSVLARSRGLINLSDNESFSLAIMEAWLCGVPVVVSANCEITTAHCLKSGGGVAIKSQTEFVTIIRTLESEPLRQALGAAGKRYARKHYSWDSVIDRLLRGAA